MDLLTVSQETYEGPSQRSPPTSIRHLSQHIVDSLNLALTLPGGSPDGYLRSAGEGAFRYGKNHHEANDQDVE
jgi:hypothetical protein